MELHTEIPSIAYPPMKSQHLAIIRVQKESTTILRLLRPDPGESDSMEKGSKVKTKSKVKRPAQ